MTAATRPLRVAIETYGCTFNVSDSEVMAGLLARDGFELCDSPAGADAVIVNSCTVKDRTLLDLEKRLGAIACGGAAPAVILAGCVPQIPAQSRRFARFAQTGPFQLSEIGRIVREAVEGTAPRALARRDEPRLALPHRRRNPAVEIIPISRGCLGECTFCQTVLARGRLRSFAEDEIEARVRTAAAEGASFIYLTSQDCGAYGLDRRTTLPRLLARLARIPGDFRIRVGMANPDLIRLFTREFAALLADPKFFAFAHIPLQSGSDGILRAMNRLYTRAQFLDLCAELHDRVPGLTLATDIIAGFPGEADDDFEETLSALDAARPPIVHRSRFSPRPGTRAARMPLLPSAAVTARMKRLYAAAASINAAHLEPLVGTTQDLRAEDTPRPGVVLARTASYLPVIVHAGTQPGEALRARISRRDGFHLVGEVPAASPSPA